MNENHNQIEGFSPELEQKKEQTGWKRARNTTGSVSNISDVSTQLRGGGGARRLWLENRSESWWDECNRPDFPEEEFSWAFKMSKATFDLICYELDPVLTTKDTMIRLAIPVRQRVAVCIWSLATGDTFRLVSDRFGLDISTCHKLVLEVCSAINTVLMSKYLQWPDEEKMKVIKSEFQSVSGIENVGGSMHTTHVPITVPKVNGRAYLNRSRTYSITVQGVVDPKWIFTDVCIGLPGSMTDATILENSALWKRANRGLLKDVWIVGSSGYPLMDWVLVPYAQQNLPSQRFFNFKTDEVHSVAEEAFSRLKGRWSCLQQRTDVKLQDWPVVIGACCVLHNICEMRNEGMDRTGIAFGPVDDEAVPEKDVRSVGAMRVRDQIAHDLLYSIFEVTGLEARSGFLEFKRGNRNQIEKVFPLLKQTGSKRERNTTGSVSNISDVSTQLSSDEGARLPWVESWWDHFNRPDFPEEEFRQAFRMSKATFDQICNELDPVITTKDTMIRLAIPVRQCVAVFIWSLGSREPLCLVSERFGLGISTCDELILDVCSVVNSVLMSKYLQWPDEEKMEEIKSEFELISGIQNVGGCMYTTNVPIIAPEVNGPAYHHRRTNFSTQETSCSIKVQGVVDSKGIFTDVSIGWPGSLTGGTILEKSALSHRANRGLLKDVWFVGNSEYPLLDWVLVPYQRPNLPTQSFFNKKMTEVQNVAIQAFSRLKWRWSCLQEITDVKLQDLPAVIAACCVLHNICEMRNEAVGQPWMLYFRLIDDGDVVRRKCPRLATVGAIRAREQIAHHLAATALH